MKYDNLINGHQITIWFSLWNGKERVSYDGRVVSEKRSFMFETIHSFEVTELNERIIYEVVVRTELFGYGYAIRRNGIIQAHKP
jgi:hypothetical protein